jgi:hypothetical protein
MMVSPALVSESDPVEAVATSAPPKKGSSADGFPPPKSASASPVGSV